ncbi:MAG: CPBP family intramembrane glutamic endopeptidase [Solirubrobacteraceae bacterium]
MDGAERQPPLAWQNPTEPRSPEPPASDPVRSPASDPARSPETDWPVWTAPLALVGGLLLAAAGGLAVDLPALAFGVTISSSHTPPGLTIADTFVQDLAFVCAAVYCAHIGGRAVRAWQFGLRRPGIGWGRAALMVISLLFLFVILSAAWAEAVNPSREKLLEELGSNEGTTLLLLSAALTCVVAPICEEFLFRGLIFTALRNWRGTLPAAVLTGLLFGGVHAGSAPGLDLVPLAALGFGLCLLYRFTGSLYPSIVAHSLNNSVAFASLEDWSWRRGLVLIASALLAIGALVLSFKRAGLIGAEPPVRKTAALGSGS